MKDFKILMFCAVDRGVFDILCPNDREAAEFCTEDPVGGREETLEVVVDLATVCIFFKASCKISATALTSSILSQH